MPLFSGFDTTYRVRSAQAALAARTATAEQVRLQVSLDVWNAYAALDSAGQQRLLGLMQAHLAGGGIIVAATHGPLGLDGAKELRLGTAP